MTKSVVIRYPIQRVPAHQQSTTQTRVVAKTGTKRHSGSRPSGLEILITRVYVYGN